jgi:sodium--glutamate symport carrier gltS
VTIFCDRQAIPRQVRYLIERFEFLQKYAIPAAVVGGFVAALLVKTQWTDERRCMR